VSSDYYGALAEEDWDEPCQHDHDEECYDEADGRPSHCTHQHCWMCGDCQCPGYCDDHQTYNLRPDETGGAFPVAGEGETR
jgi:hypothetical protein